MFKQFITLTICSLMLFSLAACDKNDTADTDNTPDTSYQTNCVAETEIETTGAPTTTEAEITISETTEPEPPTETTNDPEITTIPKEAETYAELPYTVFETKNITRITFYKYSGGGIGSDVPAHQIAEIISFLETFKVIDKKVPDIIPPGTGTIHVEIEYSDGTIVKNSLDAIEIDGALYYLTHDTPPQCYWDVLSKTSLF